MSENNIKKSLVNTLRYLEDLDERLLADMIFQEGPPPVEWKMDVYAKNGQLFFTDYYGTGAVIPYETDEILVVTIDNTNGDFDPAEIYTVGETWNLRSELIEKYKKCFKEGTPLSQMEYEIWNNMATPVEKAEEYERMADWLWHDDEDILTWLKENISEAVKRTQQRLEELEEVHYRDN